MKKKSGLRLSLGKDKDGYWFDFELGPQVMRNRKAFRDFKSMLDSVTDLLQKIQADDFDVYDYTGEHSRPPTVTWRTKTKNGPRK